MSEQNEPITVFVEFKIRTATTSLDEWLEVWENRANAALDHEPDTAAYEAAVDVEDPSKVMVFERYENGLAGLDTHMTHPSHREIGEAMGSRDMNEGRTIANIATDVPNYGWWARNDSAFSPKAAGYPMTLVQLRFEAKSHLKRFIELTSDHVHACLEHEPGTLVYSAAVASDDLEEHSPLEKDDLLLVLVSADEASHERHAMNQNHIALGEKLVGAGVGVKVINVRHYCSTGRGFLWR